MGGGITGAAAARAAGAAGAVGGIGCAVPSALPQLAQKRPFAGFSVPHRAQRRSCATGLGPKSKLGAAGRDRTGDALDASGRAGARPRGGVGSATGTESRLPQS